ncbi:MAG: hypothetical protein AAF628_19980 [Planctomycetota bacterium]
MLRSLGVNHRSFRGLGHDMGGSGCAGSPTLSVSGAFEIAEAVHDLTFTVSGGSAAASALFIGAANPVALGSCTVTVDLASPFLLFSGPTATLLVLPSTIFLGADFYAQAIQLMSGGPIVGLATASNPIRIQLGQSHLDR